MIAGGSGCNEKYLYLRLPGEMGGQREVPVDCSIRHFPDT